MIEFESVGSTVDYLAQFNLVRYFTVGLENHRENRKAIKAGLYR